MRSFDGFARCPAVLALPVVLCGSVAACDTPHEDDSAQRAVMHDLAFEVMLPMHEEVASGAAPLPEAITALCSAPTAETLAAAQAAWRDSRTPWKQAEIVKFGPAEDLRLGSSLDFWPARPDTIEAAITAAPEPVTKDHVAALGTSSKGMPALEYLLFDPAGGDAAVLAKIGAGDDASKHRCGYALALGEAIAADASALHEAWREEGGAFVLSVANAGTGSALFATGQDGIFRVVNVLIASMLQISEARLSAPLGVSSGTGPDPSLCESPYSDDSIADLDHALSGVEDVYLGRHGAHDGKGLTDLVVARSPAIDDAVRASFDDAHAKIKAIPGPLRVAISSDPAAVTAAQDAMKVTRRLLSTDVASVLGVTVTLSDSDGD